MNAIETHGLTRRFGKFTAVEDLNLAIPQGSLFGLIGPNGAGKTTTIRMLAGLLEPTSGEININGQPITHDMADLRRKIGYMPDFFGVYDDLVVWEYLDFFARCYGLPAERRKQSISELLDLVDLGEKRDAFVHTLSRGMKQRLCLAHAMIHDPQVLLLDEPASGLDPRARVEMRELLRELGAMGKTVLLSSHILAELAELCDSIAIIERGHLVTAGRLDTIRSRLQMGRKIAIRVLSEQSAAQAWLQAQPGVVDVTTEEQAIPVDEPIAEEHEPVAAQTGGTTLEINFTGDDAAVAALLQRMVGAGVQVFAFSEVHTGLEELFLQLTKGEVQ